MQWLRGLFSARQQEPAFYKPFRIKFRGGQTATAVYTPINGDTNQIVEAFGITPQRAAMFISGGASLMQAEDADAVNPMIEQGLVRFANNYNLPIVDGGTDAGIMKLIGDLRHTHHYQFPLIGVAPYGVVCYPGHDVANGVLLNPHHTHFVFTEGSEFGQESRMIAELTATLADKGKGKTLGILINGGEISRQETYDRAVAPKFNFPLAVLKGSGRFADELAKAKQSGQSPDLRVSEIIKKSTVDIIPVNSGSDRFYDYLANYLLK